MKSGAGIEGANRSASPVMKCPRGLRLGGDSRCVGAGSPQDAAAGRAATLSRLPGHGLFHAERWSGHSPATQPPRCGLTLPAALHWAPSWLTARCCPPPSPASSLRFSGGCSSCARSPLRREGKPGGKRTPSASSGVARP